MVGTPVITTRVSGMDELLGANNEWGLITDNDEDALYRGIRSLLDDPEKLAHYKDQAAVRGRDFSTEKTTAAVEDFILQLTKGA